MGSSTFTPNLGIEQPATGMYANTWGNVANRSYAVIDAALGGNAQIVMSGSPGQPYQLTTGQGADPSQALYPVIAWTGPQTGAGAVNIAPNTQQRVYVMKNQTSGGFPITFQQGTGLQYTLQPGYDAQIFCDGAGPNANVAAALDNPQFANVLVTGTLTIQGSLTGNLNLGNLSAVTLGLGAPSSVPDALTINGMGPAGEAQIRLVEVNAGNYGAILRNDGSTFFIMATASNDPYGVWAVVPFYADLRTGVVAAGGWPPNASYGFSAPSIHCSSLTADAAIFCNNIDVLATMVVDGNNTNNGYGIDILFGPGSTEGIGSGRTSGSLNQGGLTLFTANAGRVFVTNNGLVGINMLPDQALTVAGYVRATAGFVFPDGSVQVTATSGTLTQLTVTGSVNLNTASGGTTVNGNLNVIGSYLHNGVPFSSGITGIATYVGGINMWTEPGISFANGPGIQITASHTVPGQYGTITITNTTVSDERLKRNVHPLQGGLSIVNQLHPIEGEYNGLGGTREGERVVGVMAQELERLLPGCVMRVRGKVRISDKEETDLLYVSTHELLFQMLLAIQQLYERSETLYGRRA